MSKTGWTYAILLATTTVVVTSSVVFFLGMKRRQAYLALAEHHLAEMAACDSVSKSDGHLADMYEDKAPREKILAFLMPVESTNALRSNEKLYAQRASHHAALSYKYREAAAHPWVPVEPDSSSP